MNTQQWYYESNGQQAGPISWEGLMSGLNQGTISPETLVWAAHLSEWMPIRQAMQPQGVAPTLVPTQVKPVIPIPLKKSAPAPAYIRILAGFSVLLMIVGALLFMVDFFYHSFHLMSDGGNITEFQLKMQGMGNFGLGLGMFGLVGFFATFAMDRARTNP